MNIRDRLIQFLAHENISQGKFEEKVGLSTGFVSKVGDSIRKKSLDKILAVYPNLNTVWLISGVGEMLIPENDHPKRSGKNIIPLYDAEANTVGGMERQVANTDSAASPSEWIDAGDWFPTATAAIRHYGDSMVEYPAGSILALKRVDDLRLIVNGRNYVIETSEYRITKQLQYDGGDYMMAYSTNHEAHPDGRLKHSPIRIPMDAIRHIDLVLGCVVKEDSNGPILIKK